MPLYEYECSECKARGEIIQPFDAPPYTCPWCSVDMVRLISLPMAGKSARRKWAENWTPDSPAFKTGSLHGEKY